MSKTSEDRIKRITDALEQLKAGAILYVDFGNFVISLTTSEDFAERNRSTYLDSIIDGGK